jgi:outer membrane protein OmpA-like peptidoglycan-associated protein
MVRAALFANLSLAFMLTSTAVRSEDNGAAIDLLAFSSGGLVEHVSSNYGRGWEGLWLLDEDHTTGWANEVGAKPPFELIISVPEQSRFTRFAFDTASTESPERSAKDVDILVSDESATSGFKPVMRVSLKPGMDGQGFDAPAPIIGRWVKFVVNTNNGDDKYWEIMDVHGIGLPITHTPLASVSGTYESETYGKFHLQQTGAQLSGCYEHHGGLVQGGLESHLMRLTWSENAGKTHGPALMVQTRSGKGFQGLWRNEGDTGWQSDWQLKKVSNTIGSCPHWKPAGAKGNLIADDLATTGRVRLYGITFDSDKDTLRSEAKPTLDQVVAALKGHSDWKIVIEGHTDSTSTAQHNQDLSERRAAAVKTYLASAGIADARVTTTGFGQDKPVAPNDTALGRAQNRRVEIVRN